MNSMHNEGISLFAERFINKIYRYMTSITKNVYTDKLCDKIKKILTLIKKIIIKTLSLKLMILWEHQNIKNIFEKDYVPNWSEEVFVIKKVKDTVPWTYLIEIIHGEEIIGTFYGKDL